MESEAQAGQPSEVVLSTISAIAAGISRDKSALDLIPLLIPKASNSLQLETLLRMHPFIFQDTKHIFYSEKREAAQAADNYLKVNMDLLYFIIKMLFPDLFSVGLRKAECYPCISESWRKERNDPNDIRKTEHVFRCL